MGKHKVRVEKIDCSEVEKINDILTDI